MLAAASREPATLVLGLDASAAVMAEASRRAAARARKGGMPNAHFALAAAEAIPPELAGLAQLVTVRFPWGSLLRGVVGDDDRAAAGVASLVAPRGVLELVLAPSDRDGLEAIPTSAAGLADAAARAFAPFGFDVIEARAMSAVEVRATHSTWARRLNRLAVLIRLARR